MDGAGYKIQHLSIQRMHDYVGLFGVVSNARISQLTLENAQITGRNYVGALVGATTGSNATIISQVQAQGNVTGTPGGNHIGGLVGSFTVNGSVIQDSAASVVAEAPSSASSSSYRLGGLVGYMYVTSVNRSYATGTVTGGSSIGGLVGSFGSGSVTDSYATGAVNSNGATNSSSSAGGLIEGGTGNVTRSHATGSVSGGYSTGGLIGYFDYLTSGGIADSYATGSSKVSVVRVV